ncbi:DUF2325 domain-containing protein [Marispirochaeta aestuarii]|uniref:DUF2325 domain-containing protein n=1 Tax=Marispirochaeta aestuarii TaxID=1963862 RepID=UPI0029C86584|nr:DUF2325 domain-containing protein [Marispirochaeta aestuarii]
MKIVIAGGIKSMERQYKELSRQHGAKCTLFNRNVPDLAKRIRNANAVIVFTNEVSHKMASNCSKTCKKYSICIRRLSSSSMCKLEQALTEIVSNQKSA